MKKKILHKNPYFTVILNKDYYEIEPKSLDVLVIPIVDKKKFLLIKSRRKILNKNIYDLPAGGVDLKETLFQAAKREFQEETGVKLNKSNKLYKLGKLHQMPNRIKNKVTLFVFNIESKQINSKFNSDEIHSLKILSKEKLLNLIRSGMFATAVPIAALFKYFLEKKI